MRIAVIDLGTNTFNLLIAEVNATDFVTLFSTKIGVALGRGGINNKMITPDAIERALEAIDIYTEKANEYGVEKIKAIGTSAIRDAANAHELVNAIYYRFQLRVEVIDGMLEANYIYAGVSWTYQPKSSAIIMDIGGGSTEFIRCTAEGFKQACSLNIGVSRAIQLFKLSDPLTDGDKMNLISWFDTFAAPLADFESCNTLIGASGSFETFYEMMHKCAFPETHEAVTIDMDSFMDELNWLIDSTLDEREKHPYIIPIRRRMAPVAALKTKWIIDKFQLKEVVISPCSLKEGVLRKML